MNKYNQHPDELWLSKAIEDLKEWLADVSGKEPTSQLLGSGAIREAETIFSELHDGRPSLMVPSASSGMLLALKAIGVSNGTEVIIPAFDWGSTLATVSTLGATPVVAPKGISLLPEYITEKTCALVVSHVDQIVDIPAIREAVGHSIFIIEDCARVFGRKINSHLVGCFSDIAVFSFGPGKRPIDIGEGGMLLARDWDLWEKLITCGTHPLRQMVSGVEDDNPVSLSLRPHPVAAVLLAVALRKWKTQCIQVDDTDKEEKNAVSGMTYDIASVLEEMNR